MHRSHPLAASAALLLLGGSCLASPPGSIRDGYLDHAGLAARVGDLAAASEFVRVEEIGRSIEGREIFAITLASDFDTLSQRPALLLVAGFDGRHWVGTETAVRVAERIAAEHRDLLEQMSVYVIPRVNPDGAERNLGPVNVGHEGNLRPVDLDRDGEIGEDGPEDLDGDGVVVLMRQRNPPLGIAATHLADPAEPRLLRVPDRSAGERAEYALWTEGFDRDGDGRIAEDGPGFVHLDRNFPHLYPEHATGAGLHQLSEPETRALAEFVVARPHILVGVTYGRHDNMVRLPDHRQMDVTRRTPVGVMEEDLALHRALSEAFTAQTGQSRAPEADAAGSFHAWLYAHRGLASIATVVWGRPDAPSVGPDGDPAEATEPTETTAPAAAGVNGRWEGSIDLSAMAAMGEGMPATLSVSLELDGGADGTARGTMTSEMGPVELAGTFDGAAGGLMLRGDGRGMPILLEAQVEGNRLQGRVNAMGMAMPVQAERAGAAAAPGAPAPPSQRRRGGGSRGEGARGGAGDAEAAAWLALSDARGGVGFVPWRPFDHPTLGAVEIGGFVPGFTMNPPADELDALAEGHAAFIAEVIRRRPDLRFEAPAVSELAPGLYELRLAIVNEGRMPTTTAMGRRARAHLPIVLRLSTPLDRIVAGNRIERAWGIDGDGGRFEARWLLREAPGAIVEIEFVSDHFGDRLLRIPMRPDATLSIEPLPEDRR